MEEEKRERTRPEELPVISEEHSGNTEYTEEERNFPKSQEELQYEEEEREAKDVYLCFRVKREMDDYCAENGVNLLRNIDEKCLYNFLSK